MQRQELGEAKLQPCPYFQIWEIIIIVLYYYDALPRSHIASEVYQNVS